MGGDKDTKKLVADGLTPKELYEQAEDKVDSGLIEQAIDQYEMILSYHHILVLNMPFKRD